MATFILALAALAAAPSQTVFGIALGQPLALPECAKNAPIPELSDLPPSYEFNQSVTCFEKQDQNPDESWQTETIVFPVKTMPTITRSGRMETMIVGGKVIGFEIPTAGIESQDVVLDELTAKYGKPASLSKDPIQNRAGATFETITAIWTFPNLDIRFLGTQYRLDTGVVYIDTPPATKLRSDAIAKENSAHTPL